MIRVAKSAAALLELDVHPMLGCGSLRSQDEDPESMDHVVADWLDVLLEATPKGMRLDELRDHLRRAQGVEDVHDLHAWTITSGQPVVSAHVVIRDGAEQAAVLVELNECPEADFDVEHSTIQLETHDRLRYEEAHHA